MHRPSVRTAVWIALAAWLAVFFVAAAPAKITTGTAVPVIAGSTEILINMHTIVATIVHPKKAAKQAGAKLKAAVKGKKN